MKFVLYSKVGKFKKIEVEGANVNEACKNAGLTIGHLSVLDHYTTPDQTVQVFGQAECVCVMHAETGMSCQHDLEKAGITFHLAVA